MMFKRMKAVGEPSAELWKGLQAPWLPLKRDRYSQEIRTKYFTQCNCVNCIKVTYTKLEYFLFLSYQLCK